MKSHSRLVILVALLLAACGPGSQSPTPAAPPAAETLGPPPIVPATATPIVIAQPKWFFEHFEQGLPVNWIASPGWQAAPSSIQADQREQTFRIPGEWTDLVLRTRFDCCRDGWSSVGLRNRDNNYYQLSFSPQALILSRHHAEEYHGQQLERVDWSISPGWHEVSVSLAGGRITVRWDGRQVITYTDPNPLPSGDIFVQNWDDARYTLDWLEVARPEAAAVAPTSPPPAPTSSGSTAPNTGPITPVVTDTPLPSGPPPSGGSRGISPTKVIDIGITSAYLDARNNLHAIVINNGPDAYTGDLQLECTTWYAVPTGNPVGIGAAKIVSLILEPGQSSDQLTECSYDPSQGAMLGATVSYPGSALDPDPTNDLFVTSQ